MTEDVLLNAPLMALVYLKDRREGNKKAFRTAETTDSSEPLKRILIFTFQKEEDDKVEHTLAVPVDVVKLVNGDLDGINKDLADKFSNSELVKLPSYPIYNIELKKLTPQLLLE